MQDIEAKFLALEKRNQHLERILSRVAVPIFVIDRNHRITHYNLACEVLTGISAGEMIGTKNQWKAFYARQRPVLADFILENPSPADIEKYYNGKLIHHATDRGVLSGQDFFPDLGESGKWLFFTAAPVKDEQGGITGAVETLQDVTKEKNAEETNRAILKISTALPEYFELDQLMDFISSEVKQRLNTEGAIVVLLDEIKDELFFSGVSYDDLSTSQRVREFRFNTDELLAGKVIKTGKSVIINDMAGNLKQYPKRDEKLGYKTRNLLEVPIGSEGRIIGALCAINKKTSGFDDKDLVFLTMIAGTIAISLENARFSRELKTAYREVAAMNQARGKILNHLSHELKTPVAILAGSVDILENKLQQPSKNSWHSSMGRIRRNLDRIVDIQEAAADIMGSRAYPEEPLLFKMVEVCRDELETLVESCRDRENLPGAVTELIDNTFGTGKMVSRTLDLKEELLQRHASLEALYRFRDLDVTVAADDVPGLFLPREMVHKVIDGLIKNAVENTPDQGRIDVRLIDEPGAVVLEVQDHGVGICDKNQKSIFEGFLVTQKPLLYSTGRPFQFNAGGKGVDLLRMKIFSQRYQFAMEMTSRQCRFLAENKEYSCPGKIGECRFAAASFDICHQSGGTLFSVYFPRCDQ
ncbi:MAG: GAF domain-containing protein [Desulfobacteraceae bacterium]